MKYFLISDNTDTLAGMALVGVPEMCIRDSYYTAVRVQDPGQLTVG